MASLERPTNPGSLVAAVLSAFAPNGQLARNIEGFSARSGQIAMAQESNGSVMLGFAKTFLLFNRVDTFEEICAKIDSLTREDLMDTAQEIFDENRLSSLLFPAG
jgi:predicted Zn-dependent peptidase